jgi:hypothetical protein
MIPCSLFMNKIQNQIQNMIFTLITVALPSGNCSIIMNHWLIVGLIISYSGGEYKSNR